MKLSGFRADTGVITIVEKNAEEKRARRNREVDLIASGGGRLYHIQSAPDMDDPQKAGTEIRLLNATKDLKNHYFKVLRKEPDS